MPASFRRCSAVEVVVAHEIAADLRAAGHDLAGVVIHVLVRQRHAMQHAGVVALGERGIGGIRRGERFVRLDRHEGVEARLPLRDPVEAGLRHLARGDFLRRRSPSRPTSATSRPVRCSFRHLRVLHQQKARGLEIERQGAGDRRKAVEGRPDGIGDARRRLRCPTGTPATSVIALTSLASGLVMLRLLP